jgi:hypothetical protein
MFWYKFAKADDALFYWWGMFLGTLALLIGIVGSVLIANCGGSAGVHAGYVTSVEDLQNVTWNSTVVHFKSNPESTQEDKYCVADNNVRQALERAAQTQTRVLLHYHNDLILWRWQCNGGNSIIVGVDAAPTSKKNLAEEP